MRILLDERLPRRLARLLVGDEVKTVPEMGWAGVTNGRLLALAEGRFDAFVTIDRSLAFQQKHCQVHGSAHRPPPPSNRLAALEPLVPAILHALVSASHERVVHIGS